MFPSLIKSSSGRPMPFVIVGDLYHEPQVGLDHLLAGFLVALLDLGREFDFLLRREQLHLADLAQIQFDGGIAVVAGAFLDLQTGIFVPRDHPGCGLNGRFFGLQIFGRGFHFLVIAGFRVLRRPRLELSALEPLPLRPVRPMNRVAACCAADPPRSQMDVRNGQAAVRLAQCVPRACDDGAAVLFHILSLLAGALGPVDILLDRHKILLLQRA